MEGGVPLLNRCRLGFSFFCAVHLFITFHTACIAQCVVLPQILIFFLKKPFGSLVVFPYALSFADSCLNKNRGFEFLFVPGTEEKWTNPAWSHFTYFYLL